MRVGLVGFGGSGRTTLFSALTGGRAAGGGAPSAEHVGAVSLGDDERLAFLVDLVAPRKETPAAFTLVDLPGIAPGEHAALAGAREDADGLVLVVRGFETGDRFYRRPEADPSADLADLSAELLLSDLAVVEKRIEKLRVSVRKPTPRQEEERRELLLLGKIRERLEGEVPVREMEFSPEESKLLRGFGLTTGKPWLALVSLPDEGGEVPPSAHGARVKLEAELLELEPGEREVFMADLGVEALLLPGLPDLILEGMGRIRFYTMNEREVRAWDLPAGSDAVAAAGRVHTDLARGFIRAEVVAFEDLASAGDVRAAKAANAVRLEGRDYVVMDGDVIQIRFSVS